MIIFLIIDTATHFLYIFLLAFKCSLLYVSCFIVVPENQQCSRPVASGTASEWMDRRAGQVLSLISEFWLAALYFKSSVTWLKLVLWVSLK